MISHNEAGNACRNSTRPSRIHAVSKTSPSLDLHLKVRAGFVSKGTSLNRWCEENNILPSNARDVLIGRWNGPKGQALREEIVKASGVRIAA